MQPNKKPTNKSLSSRQIVGILPVIIFKSRFGGTISIRLLDFNYYINSFNKRAPRYDVTLRNKDGVFEK